MNASYISVTRRGRTWFQPAIIDAHLNILWTGMVLVTTPKRARALAKAAM